LGSKEGVAHLIWGVAGPGDTVAVADPVFPMYANQTRLCGAKLLAVPLLEKNLFLPDLEYIDRIGPRIKLLCINFPNNPTAAVAGSGFYRDLVRLSAKHGFFVSNDNVYSELYFGPDTGRRVHHRDSKTQEVRESEIQNPKSKIQDRPPSILAAPGAKDCCVEFHSLSKTFSMAGWRIGMAVGNPGLIKALLKIKQNTDSGPFGAIQDAAAYALDHAEALSRNTRQLYRRRRDVFCSELAKHGWNVPVPEATFYVWARVPTEKDSRGQGVKGSSRTLDSSNPRTLEPFSNDYRFVLDMLRQCKVVAAPGSGFGRYGRGYVRFALIRDESRLRTAAARIGKWIGLKGSRNQGIK